MLTDLGEGSLCLRSSQVLFESATSSNRLMAILNATIVLLSRAIILQEISLVELLFVIKLSA